MPILYVLIIKDKEEIKKQIIERSRIACLSKEQTDKELLCVEDQDKFEQTGNYFQVDHHFIKCNCTGLSIEESITKVCNDIDNYLQSIEHDSINTWTVQQCLFLEIVTKYNMQFYVIDGQSYLNNKRIILDIHKDTRNI